MSETEHAVAKARMALGEVADILAQGRKTRVEPRLDAVYAGLTFARLKTQEAIGTVAAGNAKAESDRRTG